MLILVKLDDAIVRISVSTRSHTCTRGCFFQDAFKNIPNKTKGDEEKIKIDEEFINSDDLSSFYE